MNVFTFIAFCIEISVSNRKESDQMLHSAMSELGLHCLHMSLKRVFSPT